MPELSHFTMHVSTPGIRTVIWPRHLLQSESMEVSQLRWRQPLPSFTVSHHSLGLHTTVRFLNPLSTKQKSGPEQNIIITHQPSIILCSNKKHWLLFLLIYQMVSVWFRSEKIQTIFLLISLSRTACHFQRVVAWSVPPVHEWPLSEWWASCSQPRAPQVAGLDPLAHSSLLWPQPLLCSSNKLT